MTARRKQKQASNSYNLRNPVEICIEIQAGDDSTLESSDADTSSTDWGTVFQKSIDGSDHSDSRKNTTYLGELSALSSTGRVLSSSESSDTDTSSTDWGTVFQKSIHGSDHSDSQNKVKSLKFK